MSSCLLPRQNVILLINGLLFIYFKHSSSNVYSSMELIFFPKIWRLAAPGQYLIFGTKVLTKNVFLVLLHDLSRTNICSTFSGQKILVINFSLKRIFVTTKRIFLEMSVLKVILLFNDLFSDNSCIAYWKPIPWNCFLLSIICPAWKV